MVSSSPALVVLVQAAARGDRRAFEQLVRAHAPRVAAVALAVTADPVTAQDAAQDAFLVAWRELGQLEDPQAFGAWVCRIARNRSRDLLRGTLRRQRRVADVDPAGIVSLAAAPDAVREQREDREVIEQALGALPEAARELLVSYYREERSTAELAADLGLTEAAVRQRLQRARGLLRSDERLAAALRRTAPTAAFVSAVLAGLAPRPALATPSRGVRWRIPALVALGTLWFAGVAGTTCLMGTRPSPVDRPAAAPGRAAASAPRRSLPPAIPTTPEPRDPQQEAYAALAAALGGHVVECPAAGCRPSPRAPRSCGSWATRRCSSRRATRVRRW